MKADADAGVLVGRAIPYNEKTRIRTFLGDFDEVVAPGALSRVLSGPSVGQVALLRDHKAPLLLARVASGTLELIDGPGALRVRARAAATVLGEETVELVRRQDLRGMSFAFVIARDSWHEQEGTRVLLRVIEDVEELFDVSVVTYPAYPQTTVSLESDTAARAADTRRRMLESDIARTGGLLRYGRTVRPSAELTHWCRSRPVRRGRQPLAA